MGDEDEYSASYCAYLEATYGEHMMAEGGEPAIERMFNDVCLTAGDKALELGYGLGGVAFYLARIHQLDITGLEVNAYLHSEANRRMPQDLAKHLRFEHYSGEMPLIYSDACFDIVFSKGVLPHVKDRGPLFAECFRVLKPGGLIIIDDWLSPYEGRWCPQIERMCQMEDLLLYPEVESNYRQLLNNAGFIDIDFRDENSHYAGYNRDIVRRLQKEDVKASLIDDFGIDDYRMAIEGYTLISEAMASGELLIRRIRATKPA